MNEFKINWTYSIFLAAAIGTVIVMSGCGGRAVVPVSYNSHKAEDGSFKIEYPAEWELESGGRSGYTWAKFTSGSAEISIDANVVGSLMADIASRGRPSAVVYNPDEDTAPVAVVHEKEREGFEESAGVKEQKPSPVQTGLIDARRSEFSGTKTFGGSIHGYRVTALSSTKRICVICQCPESEWEALKPAFDKVIASVGMGR